MDLGSLGALGLPVAFAPAAAHSSPKQEQTCVFTVHQARNQGGSLIPQDEHCGRTEVGTPGSKERFHLRVAEEKLEVCKGLMRTGHSTEEESLPGVGTGHTAMSIPAPSPGPLVSTRNSSRSAVFPAGFHNTHRLQIQLGIWLGSM